MKKVLSFLLICSLLMPTAVLAVSGEDVPYRMDFDFVTDEYPYYYIESLRDLNRLLDYVETIRKEKVYLIIEDETLLEDCRSTATAFGEAHLEFLAEEQKIGQYLISPYSISNIEEGLLLWFNWDNFDLDTWETTWHKYEGVPVLSDIEEFYRAITECKDDATYDGVFRIGESLLSYEEYKTKKLQPVFDEILALYGEDVSEYVIDTKSGADTAGSESVSYILVRISQYTKMQRKELEKEERFLRIIKNNVRNEITKEMTELEKLQVIVNSVSNIVTLYEGTGLNANEISYSMGVGQCSVYAGMLKHLCDLYGIECISGGGDHGGPHAWNRVKYRGNWYHVDTTGQDLVGYDTKPGELFLSLRSDADMKADGYEWVEENYPVCNSEKIVIKSSHSYEVQMPESVEKVALLEPYQAKNPMTIGPMIHYEVWFDATTGTIYGIDTNLESDGFEKVDGEWKVKDTVLEIPSEINGVTVKAIAPRINDICKIGNFTYMIIPDNIEVGDFAFHGSNRIPIIEHLQIGDNVIMGFEAFPHYRNITVGEDFIYKGEIGTSVYDEADEELKFHEIMRSVTVGYSYENTYERPKDLQIPTGYKLLLFGNGNNIIDHMPQYTMEVPADIIYIDPRLNRMNRRFVIAEENPYYTATEDGVLYNKDKTKLISVPIGLESIEIPDTVTEIGEYAFSYCNAIEEITIPASVKTIGNRAFWHLSNLKRIWFEGSIPDTYQPELCGDFQTISLAESACERLDYAIEREETIHINGIPQGGIPFAIFYDIKGEVLSFASGAAITIPDYAKSYDLYVWDKNLKPLVFQESGEF